MDISQEDFDKFLTWLDPDRDQAGKKYEAIRAKLIKYFAYRGCGSDAEDLADKTIFRVIRKISEIADTYVGERLPYFLAVARKVYSEYLKWLIKIRAFRPPPPPDSPEEKERLDHCLDRCMKGLTPENRKLILEYYTGDKQKKIVHRKELADELGIAPNALRIRAHRIRTDLRDCVEKCLAEDNDAEDNDAKDNDAEDNDAKDNDAKDNDAKDNDAKDNDAENNDAKDNDDETFQGTGH